ncbi:LysR family transcriptional regulator [Mesorhizobium sp. M4B.F.Ca.ET.215.01.1.1]|uniref:LysR family transcriptional regulator n=1 Tax=unclassified Mesorhizobium TaxID=325217 RepID=UPI000FCAD3A9|nr:MULTISPECIES: LysR family transcriptional regulator [unclassified Mesorhizobium]RUW20221.1 LysR family transcriptional regulator [Mesorhizobium sp. M4B.F.Ca.ET.013.02.1.1]RUW74152.1 LysR family transcriptional regulator [Mesorhizobium sp. M4B.F.Ca.ET.049.02.1.2]RVD37049.1 LysR family transcriptional regulator [Mesorhizobium sp. M4B.F.Ca.ET.019.03.1.1]RWA60210.1 MAG: LysR family transcriptional regulator [Mesorhizobium sp.]RWF67460.1 MAG: LysR family transcriptional regulator [Mesorhizobium 
MRRNDLGDLNVFLAVAEERSFTRAAARLGQSQSSLSQTVRRLEERLGMRLLTRTTRSVAPTQAGAQLIETLKPALADVEARLATLSELRDTPSGLVRVTAELHAAQTVLWPAVSRLMYAYPDVQVEISVDASFTDIVADQFDAGIRMGEQVAKDMIAVRIGPDLRMVVVGSPSYLAKHGTPHTPHDLIQHRCMNLRLPTAGGLYAWEFQKDGRELHVRVEGPLILNDERLAITAALAGHGLAMVTEDSTAQAVADGALIRVLDDWCRTFQGYHLYYPDRRHPSPAFAALLKELRHQLASGGRATAARRSRR